VLDAMLLDSQRMLVGALPEPIRLGHDHGQVNVRPRMQIPARIDSPIVLAAPLLAAEARSARLVHR
jgi:hypothetical protein